MFKSKHSGWTWDLKRTPFGGGNPLDDLSKGLGTDGFGGGVLGALASVDPGPAIGEGLASADKFMTNLTPYGWALPAALVAAYFTGGGSLAAEGATEAGTLAAGEAAATEAATAAGETAFSDAIAAGASEAEATTAANAAAESSLSAASGAGEAGTSAALQGPTYGELGYTGVEGGMAGPTYGELGYTGLNGAEAVAAADAAAAAQGGLSASDVLTNANRLKSIAKLLTGSESSPIYGKNTPTANQWATQAAQNFAQATPEQFGGYYQMNKNPFSFGTQGQTVASPGMYDVSGTNPMANALRKA